MLHSVSHLCLKSPMTCDCGSCNDDTFFSITYVLVTGTPSQSIDYYCVHIPVTSLAYGDPLRMALDCVHLCFPAFRELILGIFVNHPAPSIWKASNHPLTYILGIFLIFCFFGSLTFTGHSNLVTFIVSQTMFVGA